MLRRNKTARLGDAFQLPEDMEADMKSNQGYFAGVVGINKRRKYITLER